MSLLTKLFGQEGTVRFQVIGEDGSQQGVGKIRIESINNSKEEIEEYIKNALWVDKGIKCGGIKIIGFVEGLS